jgi:hypothetical protein
MRTDAKIYAMIGELSQHGLADLLTPYHTGNYVAPDDVELSPDDAKNMQRDRCLEDMRERTAESLREEAVERYEAGEIAGGDVLDSWDWDQG